MSVVSIDMSAGQAYAMAQVTFAKGEDYSGFRKLYFVHKSWFSKNENKEFLAKLFPSFFVGEVKTSGMYKCLNSSKSLQLRTHFETSFLVLPVIKWNEDVVRFQGVTTKHSNMFSTDNDVSEDTAGLEADSIRIYCGCLYGGWFTLPSGMNLWSIDSGKGNDFTRYISEGGHKVLKNQLVKYRSINSVAAALVEEAAQEVGA